jgi:hypothetical protein
MVGTLQYMSPEQVRGRETDARSDIYSLGVLLFDLLTGRVPFQSKNDYELMHAHIEKPPPSPRNFVVDLPEELERAVLRALAKSPEDRFATTAEFKVALDECELASIDEQVLPPAPTHRPPVQSGNDRGIEVTHLMVDDETSEASTIDCSQPTQIDATLLDQPAPRLREILAAARVQHSWAAAAVLALLLGINLLILGRMSTTGTQNSTDLDRAPVSTAIREAPARAPGDFELGSLTAPEAREPAAQITLAPEWPPAPIDWEYHSRVFSEEALRVEAAMNAEIDAILSATRPAEPPPSLAGGTTSRKPAPAPAAAKPIPRGTKVPQQLPESTGGQGWIIETE